MLPGEGFEKVNLKKLKQVAVFLLPLTLALIISVNSLTVGYGQEDSGSVTISNNILKVTINDGINVGIFTIKTDTGHPNPEEDVFFGGASENPWSSFMTIRVEDTLREYVTSIGKEPSSGYTLEDLYDYSPVVTRVSETQATVSWTTAENLLVTLLIDIRGTSLADTMVQVTVTIKNNDADAHSVAVRQMWDLMIDGDDDSWIRTWTDPNTHQSWTETETNWVSPNFQFWETTNNPSSPVFSIYGSIVLPHVVPPPTVPDRFVYAAWSDCYDTAYDFMPSGRSGMDSAVLYYWNAMEISSGAQISRTAYVTTVVQEELESFAWSCDSAGNSKSTFDQSDNFHVKGEDFPADTSVTVYLIPDGEDALPANAVTSVSTTTDTTGDLPVTLVWSQPLSMGEYDIWVDANQNEEFDAGDVWNTQVGGIYAFVVNPPANTPPYQPQLSITPSLAVEENDNLVVTVTGPTPADPEGDIVTYTYNWLVDTGTGEFLDDEAAGRGEHTGNMVPAADTAVDDVWRVEVTPVDEHGATGTSAMVTWQPVTLEPVAIDDVKPVADAGPDQAVNEDSLVTFSGSNSWDNVEVVNYKWTFTDVTPITLSGINPTYTFANPGVYTVTLTVTDAEGNSDTDTILITVKDTTLPIAETGLNQTVVEDTVVSFDAGGSSDNVGIVSYEWDFGDGTPTVVEDDTATTHTYAEPGTYTATLTVEDEAGNRVTDSCIITVEKETVEEEVVEEDEAVEEVVREPRSASVVAGVAVVGTATVAATAAAASSGAVSQALNSAVSGLPDWLKDLLQLYGKDAFEIIDKTELEAMEEVPFMTKGELASIAISALTMTLVFSFIEANGLPYFLDLSVLAVVIPSVLLAVFMENVAEVLAEALSTRICRVCRQVKLWLYGLGLFLVSGLLFRFPTGAPTITRYQRGELSNQTKGLIILSKLFILLALTLPFAGLYMLGFKTLGDAGLLMTLMTVFYYLIPLKPIVGKAIFDYKKGISILALVSVGILFFSYALNLLPLLVYLTAGVVSAILAGISLYQLRKSSTEVVKSTSDL